MGRWRPLAWRRLGMGWLGCRIGSGVTGRRRSRIAVLRLRSRILRSIRLRLRSRLWLRRLRLRRPGVRWLCHYASVGFGWPRPPRLAARAGLSLRIKGARWKTCLFTIPGSSTATAPRQILAPCTARRSALSWNLPGHAALSRRHSSRGRNRGSRPWRRRRAKRSSEPRNIAQRKSEQWPLTRPAPQLRRPPESCSRRQRMPSKRAARKSCNPHPASKRRWDAPQSVRLAGAVAQRADANAPQDGQPLAERQLEKKRRRNAGQNAGRGRSMPRSPIPRR